MFHSVSLPLKNRNVNNLLTTRYTTNWKSSSKAWVERSNRSGITGKEAYENRLPFFLYSLSK